METQSYPKRIYPINKAPYFFLEKLQKRQKNFYGTLRKKNEAKTAPPLEPFYGP